MELIRAFCGFSLASCAALLLLPEGTLRKTAALAFGLMTSLLWLDGLTHLELPEIDLSAPDSPLVATGTALNEQAIYEELLGRAAVSVTEPGADNIRKNYGGIHPANGLYADKSTDGVLATDTR